MRSLLISNLSFAVLFLFALSTFAEEMKHLDAIPAEKSHNRILPFGFYSDSMGASLGIGGISTGTIQPQATLFGMGVISSNESWLYYGAATNFQIPQQQQWLFSLDAYNGKFTQGRYYLRSNTERLVNINSQIQVTTTGHESFIRPQAKYVLPWAKGNGGAANSLKGPRTLSDLKPIKSWNPKESGTSSINFDGKWQRRDIGKFNRLQASNELTAYTLNLEYDNRNSLHIPSDGGKLGLKTTLDPGNSKRPSWTVLEFESAFFIDLETSDWARQRTIGLSVWTADTPSWDETSNIQGNTTYHRPPDFAGVTLGGWDRLRGYDGGYFYNRSAIAYSAEFRIIPAWQPLSDLPAFKTFNIPWWQWAFFLDLGNTHDEYDIAELHSQFDYSAGASLRLSIEGVLLRMDYSISEVDTQLRVLINQPF